MSDHCKNCPRPKKHCAICLEADSKESDSKESDPKESDPKESDSKESDSKEADSKESDSLESAPLPYSDPWPQRGLMHVSKMEYPPVNVACIVGKGESADDWKYVPADVYLTINEACYLLDRACFAVRGDGNTDDHRFMEWLPSHVTPIMPERLRSYYNYGWWFRWSDIGLDTICLTTLMAIRLAHYVFGASKIICVGLDNLYKDGTSYHPNCANARNRRYGVRRLGQRDRIRALEPVVLSKCQHYGHIGGFVKGGIG